jgi:hypothetical protein
VDSGDLWWFLRSGHKCMWDLVPSRFLWQSWDLVKSGLQCDVDSGSVGHGFGTCVTWTWSLAMDLGPGCKWVWDMFDLVPTEVRNGFGTCGNWYQVDMGPVGIGAKNTCNQVPI